MRKEISNQEQEFDYVGNNAAFTCPICMKVFIVSGLIHKGKRKCPGCGKSVGYVHGGQKAGGTAYLEY